MGAEPENEEEGSRGHSPGRVRLFHEVDIPGLGFILFAFLRLFFLVYGWRNSLTILWTRLSVITRSLKRVFTGFMSLFGRWVVGEGQLRKIEGAMDDFITQRKFY